jgi:hypothetical protein
MAQTSAARTHNTQKQIKMVRPLFFRIGFFSRLGSSKKDSSDDGDTDMMLL